MPRSTSSRFSLLLITCLTRDFFFFFFFSSPPISAPLPFPLPVLRLSHCTPAAPNSLKTQRTA
ncbi:predicted protein [Plenodomus lingam JN3]|uniref:Predicted protein n=1 Tax=Leptosphaeria maculans (strain JN3 / isolate v23.1.3 / race Av1-4-5-6-7-8) TaxID=985895 RepID=E4ZSJ8_LEPMJ|nr:predicted protein [Plenodomus lingam JN3]CBX94378.1 predicted protein [Plenodomus lingam JN3]